MIKMTVNLKLVFFIILIWILPTILCKNTYKTALSKLLLFTWLFIQICCCNINAIILEFYLKFTIGIMNSSLHSNTCCLASLSWMLYRLCSGNISSGRSSTAGVVLFSDLSTAAGLGWMSVLSSFLPQSYYHSDLIHSTVTDHRWFIHPNATYWCCNVIYPLMVCTITESDTEVRNSKRRIKCQA